MIIFRSGLGCPVSPLVILDGLDLEMESNEGEHQTLEVLDEIVETAETVWVAGLVDVHQGPDLAGGEADVLVPDHDLQLLAAHAVRLRPQRVVLGHDLAVLNDPPQLVHHGAVDVGLLADHRVVLVVAVVGIPDVDGRLNKIIFDTLFNKFSKQTNLSLPSGLNSNSKNSCPNFPLWPT